ncbi:MAG: methyltransferase domain-containing protein [Candidatus Aminicenantes bacterium]|nr:methyltransferase domain-containing protein [Candidatus Aminicenantes bacterium]
MIKFSDVLVEQAYAQEIKARREFFNALALRWENEFDQGEGKSVWAEIIDLFDLKPGQVVLDAGCGSGCLIPYILERIGEEGKLIAVDISEKMLALARKKWSGPHVFFIQADVSQLGLIRLIDRLICFRLFPHLPDKRKALLSFCQYLKREGQLFIVHPASRKQVNDFHANLPTPLCRDKLPDKNEMMVLFRMAGLNIIDFWERENFYFIRAKIA